MDKRQLTTIFLGLRQRLRAIAAPITGEEAAEDALQEAFLRLWARREKIPDRQAAEGLSIVTVRHVAIDEARRRELYTRQKRPDGAAEALGSQAEGFGSTAEGLGNESAERFEEVKRLIFSRLEERQAQILWRRDYQEWDFGEIAAEYGLSEANVRQIVSRARKEIRNIYRQYRNG